MSNITITDLKDSTEVTTAESAEVKGGPAFIKFDGIDGECTSRPMESLSLNFEKARF